MGELSFVINIWPYEVITLEETYVLTAIRTHGSDLRECLMNAEVLEACYGNEKKPRIRSIEEFGKLNRRYFESLIESEFGELTQGGAE